MSFMHEGQRWELIIDYVQVYEQVNYLVKYYLPSTLRPLVSIFHYEFHYSDELISVVSEPLTMVYLNPSRKKSKLNHESSSGVVIKSQILNHLYFTAIYGVRFISLKYYRF